MKHGESLAHWVPPHVALQPLHLTGAESKSLPLSEGGGLGCMNSHGFGLHTNFPLWISHRTDSLMTDELFSCVCWLAAHLAQQDACTCNQLLHRLHIWFFIYIKKHFTAPFLQCKVSLPAPENFFCMSPSFLHPPHTLYINTLWDFFRLGVLFQQLLHCCTSLCHGEKLQKSYCRNSDQVLRILLCLLCNQSYLRISSPQSLSIENAKSTWQIHLWWSLQHHYVGPRQHCGGSHCLSPSSLSFALCLFPVCGHKSKHFPDPPLDIWNGNKQI